MGNAAEADAEVERQAEEGEGGKEEGEEKAGGDRKEEEEGEGAEEGKAEADAANAGEGGKGTQFGTICRTIAKMCKLEGSCPEECAQADMINECAKDVMDAFYNCHNEKNECMKKGMMCKFMDETVPKFCEQMTCLLKKNGGKYFVGDCLTYADLAVACTLDSLCLNCPNADMTKCMQKYKELCCHHSMVCGLPAIKEHCAKRPSTPL